MYLKPKLPFYIKCIEEEFYYSLKYQKRKKDNKEEELLQEVIGIIVKLVNKWAEEKEITGIINLNSFVKRSKFKEIEE